VDTREVSERLSTVPMFSECTKRELQAIARAVKQIEHPDGHVIAREGDRGVGFFLITEGKAAVSIGGKNRARLGPGDFFGEISLLDRGPRTATVTSTSPIRLLGLTAWVFRGLIEEHPAIGIKLLEVLARRLRGTSKPQTTS
jgi:CRP/FNR family transcriptional regulator, cyclic AMP receptor protein